MNKKVVKLSFIVDIEAEIDFDKGELNESDKLSIGAEIDAAVRDYDDTNIIYPPDRPDFNILLLRIYEKKY